MIQMSKIYSIISFIIQLQHSIYVWTIQMSKIYLSNE